MTIQLQLFARASELAGAEMVDLDLDPPVTVEAMKRKLIEQFPALAPIASSLMVAVNDEYADQHDVIPDNAELACFPPVSGG